MIARSRCWACVLLLAVLHGCSRKPALPADTGAKELIRNYYVALMRQDWQQAYDAVDASSQDRMSLQEFTALAQTYRRNLGEWSCHRRSVEMVVGGGRIVGAEDTHRTGLAAFSESVDPDTPCDSVCRPHRFE
jgi:hypothetical protein